MSTINIYPKAVPDPSMRMRWPEADPIPEGYTTIEPPAANEGHTVEWDGGDWAQVPIPTVEEPGPVDPLTLALTKRQVNAALILAGHTDPDAFIEVAIATVEDETARALAFNDWRYAPYYERGHPLFNDPTMLAATEMTSQEIDALWTVATEQPL